MKFDCERTCRTCEAIDDCRFNSILLELGPIRVNSYISEIDVEYRDLGCLAAAASSLGLTLELGRKDFRAHRSDDATCDHAMHLQDATAYGIGLTKDGKSYKARFDVFGTAGRALTTVIGKQGEKLTAAYTEQVVRKQAQRKGYIVRQTEKGLEVIHPRGGRLHVSVDGKIEAQGFKGSSCHEHAKIFEEVLGNPQGQVKKQSFQMQKQKVRQS